ncbi:unnamed protein product [Nesidiocoris tenuis]|uniref:PCI domain-containing protein n=1 Tax=Nesidiocoris tenuis TaxID=355587 RepID=A0A6H5GDA0_9HEMI|nr:unnamed protein product [Nesidiocoris tenuis]
MEELVKNNKYWNVLCVLNVLHCLVDKSNIKKQLEINKQTEQMYHLLAICLVLHPQCIDDSIQQLLREKNYHEKMYKMQIGDLNEFEACFLFACPKFLSASWPNLNGMTPPDADYVKDATKHQTEVFMDEVKQQITLPIIRSYLKLYTTLPLDKLSSFMEATNSDKLPHDLTSLRTHLLCFKHKMKNVVWTKGTSGLEGSFQSGSEVSSQID